MNDATRAIREFLEDFQHTYKFIKICNSIASVLTCKLLEYCPICGEAVRLECREN